MSLTRITIENFRSIESVELDCTPQSDGSATFGLIGLNEAGKSSLLKAIALANAPDLVAAKDFLDKEEDIGIWQEYHLADKQFAMACELAIAVDTSFQSDLYKKSTLHLYVAFAAESRSKTYWLGFVPKKPSEERANPDWVQISTPPPAFAQTPIFWKAADNYLIAKPINLAEFAADPTGISIPLRNCFLLAGMHDIPKRIANLVDASTEIDYLQRELGRTVTAHIKAVWPNHPIEISFLITNNLLHFHVRDIGSGGKAKTADQRSDGFRQFVSFLLTVSAQNRNEELKDTILLLDEPETHLHPLAQEYLLSELIAMTKNNRNNVVFFATHSNYMIDKTDLSRNFRVTKIDDKTEAARITKKTSTYAGVSYEVFSIASSDYHNELYGILHERYLDDEKRDSGIQVFDEEFFHKIHSQKKNKPWKGNPNGATLPTFVRNCIHHPEGLNKCTSQELRQSIEFLRKLVQAVEAGPASRGTEAAPQGRK